MTFKVVYLFSFSYTKGRMFICLGHKKRINFGYFGHFWEAGDATHPVFLGVPPGQNHHSGKHVGFQYEYRG